MAVGSAQANFQKRGLAPSARSSFGQPADQSRIRNFHFDAILSGALLLALLFNPVLKSLAPAIMIFVLAVMIWLRGERLLRSSPYALLLLLLPSIALLSAIWSINASATLRYGILYFLTVCSGIMIGAGLERGRALVGIFIAFFVYTVASVLFGGFTAWGGGGGGGLAFVGLANSKNASGDTAALGLLASLAMFSLSLQRRWTVGALLALLIIPVQIWVLVKSNATGSLIAGAAASLCMICWLLSQRLAPTARSAIFIVITMAIVIALLTQSLWLPDLFETVLKTSGKDAGLTGRSYLWERGWQYISERPVAGLGYGAFWVHGNLDAEGLWRFAGIGGRSGFNFHNSAIEILVHLGYLGLAAYALIFVPLIALLFFRTMIQPTPTAIFFCAIATYEMIRMSFESLGFGQIHFTTVIIYASMSSSLYQGYNPSNFRFGRN